ncbi:NAD(P)H-quinone oxidoreductase subunit F [Mycobacteroides abscessus subsp. abscessus]|nr:NAD(P)H-quinone oxidoreductase subunit F [Mycobacteroides abscessus subsp. abscessus]
MDEFYRLSIVQGMKVFSLFLHYIEAFIVEGAVKGIGSAVQSLGKAGSRFQDGQVQTYGAAAFIGLAILTAVFALTGGFFK